MPSVCFIGDSITAAEKFTRILVDYFVLHYPEKHILFHNVAIPGGSAALTLKNWERLVGRRAPSYATILFGMNDLKRSLYADSARPTASLSQKKENAILAFEANMQKLHAHLAGVKTLTMTPTPHDESPEIHAPLYAGYNAALAKAGRWIRENLSPVLDLHTLFSEAYGKGLLKTQPAPDRVHPQNVGQALIAYHILKSLGIKNPRLPLWDSSFTDAEKAELSSFGIQEDTSPKNSYSDARTAASVRLSRFYYVELYVLQAQGIVPEDTEKADALFKKLLTMPIEPWQKEALNDYMKNRHTIPEQEKDLLEIMENMYR